MKLLKKHKLRRLPREYGIGDFLSWVHHDGGITRVVKRIQREEQLMLNFHPKGKPIN